MKILLAHIEYLLVLLLWGTIFRKGLSKTSLRQALSHWGWTGIAGMIGVTWLQCLSMLLGGQILLGHHLLFLGLFFLILLRLLFPLRQSYPSYSSEPWGKIEVALLLLVLFQLFYVFLECAWRPVAMNDDWAQWAGNGKYLFHTRLVDKAYFLQLNHSSYPLLLMVNEVLFCDFLGSWDDFWCKCPNLYSLVFFLSLLWQRKHIILSRKLKLSFALLWVFIPWVIRIGLDGTADLLQSMFFGAAYLYLVDHWYNEKNKESLFLGFLCGGVALIKLEGFYLAGLIGIAALTMWAKERERSILPLLGLFFSSILTYGLWTLVKQNGWCSDTRFEMFTLSWLWSGKEGLEIGKTLLKFILPSKFLAIFPLSYVYLRFLGQIKKTVPPQVYWADLLIGGMVGIYLFGSYSTGWGSEFSRLLNHSIGIMWFAMAFQIKALLNRKNSL